MDKLPKIAEETATVTTTSGINSAAYTTVKPPSNGETSVKPYSPELNEEETKKGYKLRETLLLNPKLERKELSASYEKPLSNRELWWRHTVKPTPLPNAYQDSNSEFIEQISKKVNTYSFKSDGRRIHPTPQIGKGDYLLPGAYDLEGFQERIERLNITYGFKGPERDFFLEKNLLMYHDKDASVSPNNYNTEKYGTISARVEPSKLSSFKSKTRRNLFPPKEGPSPGMYNAPNLYRKPSISSSFRSKTVRFKRSKEFTPGPGAYWPITSLPVNSRHLEELGTKGVFFTPNFNISATI